MQLYQIRPNLWKTLGNLPGNHHISNGISETRRLSTAGMGNDGETYVTSGLCKSGRPMEPLPFLKGSVSVPKDCKTMKDRMQMQNQAQTVCEAIKSHGKATLTHGDKGGSKKPDIKGFPSKNASHLIKFVGNCPRLACVHKMFTNFSHAVGHLKRISVACTTDFHHHSLGIASCINSS